MMMMMIARPTYLTKFEKEGMEKLLRHFYCSFDKSETCA
jgi:hypothetical protein